MASAPAKIYTKTAPGPDEKVCIFYPRCGVSYPFEATNWLDLRVGFFVSMCAPFTNDASNDVITGLSETMGANMAGPQDAYWIGVKNRGETLPATPGNVFVGFTNWNLGRAGVGKIVSSNAGVGTSPADYWRATSSIATNIFGGVLDGESLPTANFIDGTQQHFVQSFAGGHAAGYAALISFRLTRPSSGSNLITVQTFADATNHTGNYLYSSTPTQAAIQAQLEAFPTQIQQIGPITISAVPDALFLYWPFSLSRLRCHSTGIVQAR